MSPAPCPLRSRSAPALSLLLLVAAACSGPSASNPPAPPTTPQAAAADAGVPPPPPAPQYFLPRSPTASATDETVGARLFAFADTQLHYMFGKRTFAQSPFADRMAFEVAIRPAALDDGSDLMLAAVASEYASRYADHGLVFLGDAADLSCTQELLAFLQPFAANGAREMYSVTSNHDGFFVGNFTSKEDLDGNLALTDMPNDWTRACSSPNSFDDRRLTKGKAVELLSPWLPDGPLWASSVSHHGALGPDDYKATWMYYVRRLPGGDAGSPPVWGIFLDTVDYRGFDLHSAQGAGSTGAVSRQQLRFLDRAMFEAAGTTPGERPAFVVFGHHPLSTLEPSSQKRLKTFMASRTEVVAYVAAHEHAPGRRSIAVGDRLIPEYVIGSTTDAPNTASIIEVRFSGNTPRLAVTDLQFDTELCDDVPSMPPTSLGYTGYRIGRDDTPDVELGVIDKLAFVIGASELEGQRAKQAIGALLVENELVRSLADLYLRSPLTIDARERARLRGIIMSRYAAGNSREALAQYIERDTLGAGALSPYEQWDDPAIARRVATAGRGLHRFGTHADLFHDLRKRRLETPDAHRYFLCHAAFASAAEAKQQRQRGDLLYIR